MSTSIEVPELAVHTELCATRVKQPQSRTTFFGLPQFTRGDWRSPSAGFAGDAVTRGRKLVREHSLSY